MVFLNHKKTMLDNGRLVKVVSDESLRGFNVVSCQIFQEGFAKLNPAINDLPEPIYEFPTMVGEDKAFERYKEIIKLNKK